jgi:ankyrin repeat protein
MMAGEAPQHLQDEVVSAARDGRMAEVKRLIEQDRRLVEATWLCEYTVLTMAVSWGHVDIVAYLLDQGAAINRKPVLGSAALEMACSSGHAALVDLLLERGADATTGYPLYAASSSGDAQIVQLLLAHGCGDIDWEWHNWTALHEAVAGGRVEVARVLMEAGADPTITDSRHQTALDLAIEADHTLCIELLQVRHCWPEATPGSQCLIACVWWSPPPRCLTGVGPGLLPPHQGPAPARGDHGAEPPTWSSCFSCAGVHGGAGGEGRGAA